MNTISTARPIKGTLFQATECFCFVVVSLPQISVTGSYCQYYSNRDIILTPHQLKTYPGKILYYRPHEFTTGPGVLDNVVPAQQGTAVGTAVPWEEVLKETVFLALNDNKTR